MDRRIYLDNNATTPVDSEVLDVLVYHLKNSIGNPSSIHFDGREANLQIIKARQTIADSLKVKPQEIIFTSGGTEGACLALRGLFPLLKKGPILSSGAEHPCVYITLKSLEKQGCQTLFLNTKPEGRVAVEDVREALSTGVSAIVLMAANNETGVKTDIAAIAALAEEAGVPFIVDGVALLGKELFSIPSGVTAMFFSGHKIHAPKGIGFMFVKRNFKLMPLITGGSQEFSRRGGTENLAGICALARAVATLEKALPSAEVHMRELRDLLERSVLDKLDGVAINGQGPRVCNTSNLAFSGIEGETLLMRLDMAGVAVSHGSACASGALEPSRVLLDMGLSREAAASSLRVSLSRMTTKSEVEAFVDILVDTVLHMRKTGWAGT